MLFAFLLFIFFYLNKLYYICILIQTINIMTQKESNDIIKLHEMWLNNEVEGNEIKGL